MERGSRPPCFIVFYDPKTDNLIFTERGTAQLLSDSRNPADFHRTELISLDEARQFIELVATSVEREGETFVDLWGKAVLTPLGQQILAGT